VFIDFKEIQNQQNSQGVRANRALPLTTHQHLQFLLSTPSILFSLHSVCVIKIWRSSQWLGGLVKARLNKQWLVCCRMADSLDRLWAVPEFGRGLGV
jgi:hypothetical protein